MTTPGMYERKAYLADSLFLGASGPELAAAASLSLSPGAAHVAAQVKRVLAPLPPPPAKAASAAALRFAAAAAVSSSLSPLFSSRPTGASKRTALLVFYVPGKWREGRGGGGGMRALKDLTAVVGGGVTASGRLENKGATNREFRRTRCAFAPTYE